MISKYCKSKLNSRPTPYETTIIGNTLIRPYENRFINEEIKNWIKNQLKKNKEKILKPEVHVHEQKNLLKSIMRIKK